MAEKAQIEASTMDWAKKNYELRMAKYFTDTWNLLSSHWKYLLPYSIIVTAFCKAIELIPDDYMKVSFLFLFMIPFNAGFFYRSFQGEGNEILSLFPRIQKKVSRFRFNRQPFKCFDGGNGLCLVNSSRCLSVGGNFFCYQYRHRP